MALPKKKATPKAKETPRVVEGDKKEAEAKSKVEDSIIFNEAKKLLNSIEEYLKKASESFEPIYDAGNDLKEALESEDEEIIQFAIDELNSVIKATEERDITKEGLIKQAEKLVIDLRKHAKNLQVEKKPGFRYTQFALMIERKLKFGIK